MSETVGAESGSGPAAEPGQAGAGPGQAGAGPVQAVGLTGSVGHAAGSVTASTAGEPERSVTVRLFAAAAHAAGHTEVEVPAVTLAQALTIITEASADPERFAEVLARCSVLVDGVYHDTDEVLALPAGAMVDVLPPFAGG